MKNLAEEMALIKKSDMSVEQKKVALIKLGIRPRDVEYLEFTGFFNEKTPLTFGVEIECNVPRERIAQSANGDFKFYYEGYNHRDNREYYKFVSDGSLDGPCPIECVSPILDDNTDGFKSLENCLHVLNRAGAFVNRSCGLHVHVGLSGFKGREVVNIYKNYQKLESLIDSFMAPSRRNNSYAAPIRGFNYSNCNSPEDVIAVMGGRYYKVNPMAYNRHRTIEFRQHQGSVSFDKISNWIKFCCKLVEWSKENVFDTDVTDINDVPFLNAEEKAFFAERIARFAAA